MLCNQTPPSRKPTRRTRAQIHRLSRSADLSWQLVTKKFFCFFSKSKCKVYLTHCWFQACISGFFHSGPFSLVLAQAQNQQNDADIKKPPSERPPYSYMAMIQFAINSRKNRRMTLKEIYTWIEDHFPYFRQVAKPGWKVFQN